MDFDEIVVKEGPGLCRCCLSEGCYKDLATEYTWMNETEVYADMLLECFDISISQHSEGPNGPNRLICEVCITRLRDACNFKKQVLDSEKRFVDMVGRGDFKAPVVVYQQDVNVADNVQIAANEDDAEYLDEDTIFMDDNIKIFDEKEDQPGSSDITVTTLPVKAKRGRPKKNTTIVKPEKKSKLSKDKTSKLELKSKAIKGCPREQLLSANIPEALHRQEFTIVINRTEELSKQPKLKRKNLKSKLKIMLPGYDESKRNREEKRQKKNELTTILYEILESSTAIPFRWYCNKYMCFFCFCPFIDSMKLKQHIKEEHQGAKSWSILRSLIGTTSIKLDITELSCKKCPKPVGNLEEFLAHLSEAHDFKHNEDVSKNIFAFKLSDDGMNCLDCGASFRFFGPLLTHVNKFHNRLKSYVCEICGQAYVTKTNVDSHVKAVHSRVRCEWDQCGKVFPTPHSLSIHYDKTHFIEKLKCPKCPEILGSRYLKKKHLALVHDVKSAQYKCNVCSKIFTIYSKMVQHHRRVHLQEKNLACEICGFRVFNKELLRRHMVSHDDSRPFQCEFCKKAFQRKKSLEYHRRIHTNDRRYVCKECGKAFVQITSLKLHVKVHHSAEK